MQLIHQPLQPVQAARVLADVLGAEDEGTHAHQGHAQDAARHQVGQLLGHQGLARDPEPTQEDGHQPGAHQGPAHGGTVDAGHGPPQGGRGLVCRETPGRLSR